MEYRQVRFTPRRMDWSGDPGILLGAKYQHRLTKAVDFGQGRIEPVWSIAKAVGSAALVLDLPVTPVDVDWAVQVYSELPDGQGKTVVQTETVKVPAGSYTTILDFEDLERVDPNTLGPVTAPTSVWESRLATVEAQIAAGGGSGGGAPPGTGTAGAYKVGDLEDITTVGEAVALAADAGAARSAIGAPAVGDLPTWSTIGGKPTVIAAGSDQSAARSAIGAGTSNLVVGTGTGQAADGAAMVAALSGLDSRVVALEAGGIPAVITADPTNPNILIVTVA